MLILTSDSPSKHAKYRMLKVSPQLFMIKLKLAYTQQPKKYFNRQNLQECHIKLA